MNFKLFIAFLFLIGAINAVPTRIYNHKTKTCSNTCLNHENNLMNKIGHTYKYNYDSKSLIEMNDGQTASVHLSALIDVSTISKCEYQLRLRDVKIVGPKDTELMKKQLERFSTKFSQDNSIIDSICFDEMEEKWAINIKKAIISNLQVTQRDSTSKILEADVLGLCDTLYKKTEESSDLIMLERTKFLDTCTRKYRKMNFITPRMSEDEKTICKIELDNKKHILQTIKCEEINSLPLFTLSRAASKVSTHTKLTFENIVNTLPEITNKDLIKDKLYFNHGKWEKTSEEDQTKVLLRAEEILEKINSRINFNLREETPEQVKDLSELLEKLNNQSLESLARRVSKYNKKTQYVFFDTVAQTNTLECADLILKVVLDNHFFKEELSTLRKNYWLSMLNNVEEVSEKVFSIVSRYIKRENLPRQALLGLTSLVSNVRYQFATKENKEYRQIVEALINRLERTEQKEEKIVILKALKNTGIHREAFEKIFDLIKRTKDIEIQVSALEILDEHVFDKEIYNKIFKIYQDESYDALLRISAFKALIINQDRFVELHQVLKRESNTQVGSYVLSFFKNIERSSDERYDALKSIVSTLELPEGKFNKNTFSNSKNFVLYKKIEQVDMEVEVESDLVFDNQDQLRKIRTEFYLNKPTLLNKKIEVNFMQNGLPEVAQHYLQQLSKEESLSSLFEELYKLSSIRSKKMLVEKMNKLFETIKLVNLNKINKFDKNIDASISIKYGEKNVLYINLNDLENWSISERKWDDKKTILNEITKTIMNEHTLTLILNNKNHERPTFSGVPVHTRHSYVFMFALKTENGAIYPSLAANIHYESGLTMKNLRPAVLYSLNLHSAPGLKMNVEFKNNVPVRLVVKMPENRLNIISIRSLIKFRTLTEETELKVKTDLNKDCTKFLNKIFGVELCYKAVKPTSLVEKNALNVLFNGPFEFSLYIGKTDLSIKEWELTFETPLAQRDGETKTLRLGFDTVNSKVDRKTFIELEMKNREDLKIVNINMKTPRQIVKLEGKALLNNKNAALKGILMIDNIKYEAEISGEQIISADKFEIKPVLRLIVPGMRKFDYTGKILLTNSGKKDNLIVELMDKITQKHLLKASFIKSGKFGLKDNLKLATDLHAYLLSGSNVRFVSNIDKSDKGISSDLEIIHYAPHKAPTTYKWKFGLQNLSNESVEKLNADFELNIPRTSFENIAFSWNFANRYGQEIENEFLAFWKNQKTGQKQRQVHISQSLKMNKLSAKISSLWENFMKIEIVPLEINYDIQTKNSFKRSQQKYQIQMNVRNVKTEKHYTGDLQYQITDTFPMKFNIEAKVNIENNEFKFVQSLVEQEKKNYLGHTLIQLAKNQEIELNYVYKVKDQNLGKKVLHHELEAELKVPFKSIDLKHKSNLRMTSESIELEHFLKKNEIVLSDVKIFLRSLGQSQLFIDNQMFKLKTTVDLSENKNEIYLLIDGKTSQFNHESKLNWSKKTVDLISKTLLENRQTVDLSMKFVESQNAELRLKGQFGDLIIRTDYQKQLTTVEFNSMYRNKKMLHKTEILREAEKYVLDSKTLHDDKTIANIKLDFNILRNPSNLLVKIFNWQITGKTIGASQFNLVLTNPIRNLREELNLQYQENEGSIEFKHLDNKKQTTSVLGKLSLKDESKLQYSSEHIDFEFLLRPVSQNTQFKLLINDKKHSLKHKTDFRIKESEINFEIDHQRFNKIVLKHNTKLSLNEQSHTRTETKDFTFEGIYKINRALEITLNHQNGLRHSTILDLDLTKLIKLSSKTTKNGKQLFFITFNSDLMKMFDLKMELEDNSLIVKSKMDRQNVIEILFTNPKYDHKTELNFEMFRKLNLVSETKNLRKSDKNVRLTIDFLREKKFDLLFKNEFFEITSRNTKETKENKMVLEILNLKTKEQYKGLINLERRNLLNFNLEKLHNKNVVSKFTMKITDESLIYEFNNERMTLKNNFELKDKTISARFELNHIKRQIQHDTTFKIDRIEKEIHFNSITTKENKKTKVEMRINLKNRKNYLRIESEDKHMKIEANLNKYYNLELVDGKIGYKHVSELNLEKNLLNLQTVYENKKYFELSTQMKDRKLVFDLKSKIINLLINGDLYKKDLVLNLDYINQQNKHCQTELLIKKINDELRFNFNNKHFDISKTSFKFVLDRQNKFDTEFNFEEVSSPNKIHFVFNTIKNIDSELNLNLRSLKGKATLKTLSKNTYVLNVEAFNKQNQKIVDMKSNLNNKDDKIVFTVDFESQTYRPYTLNMEIGKESEIFEIKGLIKSKEEKINSFVVKYNMRNTELVLNSEIIHNQEKYEFDYNLVFTFERLNNSLKIKTTRKTYGYDLNVDYKQGKFIVHLFDRIVEFNYDVQKGNDGHYVVDFKIIPDVKRQPNNIYNVKLINFVKYTHEEAIYDSKIIINHPKINVPIEIVVRFEARGYQHQRPLTVFVSYDASKDQKHRLSALFEITNESNMKVAHFNVSHQNHIIFDVQYKWAFLQNLHHQQLLWSVMNKDNQNVARNLLFRINYAERKALVSLDDKHKLDIDWEEKSDETHVVVLVKSENLLRKIRILLKENHIEMTTFENGKIRSIYVANVFRQENTRFLVELSKKEGKTFEKLAFFELAKDEFKFAKVHFKFEKRVIYLIQKTLSLLRSKTVQMIDTHLMGSSDLIKRHYEETQMRSQIENTKKLLKQINEDVFEIINEYSQLVKHYFPNLHRQIVYLVDEISQMIRHIKNHDLEREYIKLNQFYYHQKKQFLIFVAEMREEMNLRIERFINTNLLKDFNRKIQENVNKVVKITDAKIERASRYLEEKLNENKYVQSLFIRIREIMTKAKEMIKKSDLLELKNQLLVSRKNIEAEWSPKNGEFLAQIYLPIQIANWLH